MRVRFSVVAAAFVLAGAGAARAQSGLDGVYRAPAGGAAGNAACGTTRFGYPLRVSNGVASLQTVSGGELQGRVGPDGSVSIQEGPITVTGRITGPQFNGTFVRGRCSFALNYTKG